MNNKFLEWEIKTILFTIALKNNKIPRSEFNKEVKYLHSNNNKVLKKEI